MNLTYSLIAMQVERIPTIKDLVQKLKDNPVLRYNCGFDVLGSVPSESTFSRFLSRLSLSDELSSLFSKIVLQAKELGIIDGSNVAIDATKISSFEASVPKSKIVDDGTNPNWGIRLIPTGTIFAGSAGSFMYFVIAKADFLWKF